MARTGRPKHPTGLESRKVSFDRQDREFLQREYGTLSDGVRQCIRVGQMLEDKFGLVAPPDPSLTIEDVKKINITIETDQIEWVCARHSGLSAGIRYYVRLRAVMLEGKSLEGTLKRDLTVDLNAATG